MKKVTVDISYYSPKNISSRGSTWIVTVQIGNLGVCVNYITKPTKVQLRKLVKAFRQSGMYAWGRTYDEKSGKFV